MITEALGQDQVVFCCSCLRRVISTEGDVCLISIVINIREAFSYLKHNSFSLCVDYCGFFFIKTRTTASFFAKFIVTMQNVQMLPISVAILYIWSQIHSGVSLDLAW